MKTILNVSTCMIALCMLCTAAQAQERQQRLNREQLAEAQARHIAKEMAMDDTTSTRFIDAYCSFQKERHDKHTIHRCLLQLPKRNLGTRSQAPAISRQQHDR